MSQDERKEGLAFAPVDLPGDMTALREQGCHQARATGSGARPPDRQEGTDASDSVWVTVDAHGRVVDLDISGQWWKRPQAADSAGALFAASTAAVQKASDSGAAVALGREHKLSSPGGYLAMRLARRGSVGITGDTRLIQEGHGYAS